MQFQTNILLEVVCMLNGLLWRRFALSDCFQLKEMRMPLLRAWRSDRQAASRVVPDHWWPHTADCLEALTFHRPATTARQVPGRPTTPAEREARELWSSAKSSYRRRRFRPRLLFPASSGTVSCSSPGAVCSFSPLSFSPRPQFRLLSLQTNKQTADENQTAEQVERNRWKLSTAVTFDLWPLIPKPSPHNQRGYWGWSPFDPENNVGCVRVCFDPHP